MRSIVSYCVICYSRMVALGNDASGFTNVWGIILEMGERAVERIL